MGGKIVHCGEAGAGQAAKICNNMILGISMIGVCEAFALAEKLGLSHQSLFDVASTSVRSVLVAEQLLPGSRPVPNSPANRDYQPGFATALMLKDLKLAQAASLKRRAPRPRWAVWRRSFTACMPGNGQAGTDFPASSSFCAAPPANRRPILRVSR